METFVRVSGNTYLLRDKLNYGMNFVLPNGVRYWCVSYGINL
jgi:hypothetical protein